MAAKKLVRDMVLLGHPLRLHLSSQPQASSSRLRLITAGGHPCNRRYSVFNEFSKKVKGEVSSNPEFQKSVKQLKEKAEELQGVKEELKVRTKQTTEQLYKHVDSVSTEGKATTKKVSASVKEETSPAAEEAKEQFGMGKPEESALASSSTKHDGHAKGGNDGKSTEEKCKQAGSDDNTESFFGKYRTRTSFSSSLKVTVWWTPLNLKGVKVIDLAKKGYHTVRDELSGSPSKREHMDHAPTTSTVERSTRTDEVILPSMQCMWEASKEKSVDNVQERWETSDNPVSREIENLDETIFRETEATASMREIRWRNPLFSLTGFVAGVQEVVKPVLNAYIKGDVATLKKYCSSEIIGRCKAEHGANENRGIFVDKKILHVCGVDVRETKMLGTSPIIIVSFLTHQMYCVRDRNGAITKGGEDTMHHVYYEWAMQQVYPVELGEGASAIYPSWRLRAMRQIDVRALP